MYVKCLYVSDLHGQWLLSNSYFCVLMQSYRSSCACKTLAQTVCYCLLVHVATPTIVDVDDDACLLVVYKLETLTFRSLFLFASLVIVRSELGTTHTFATAN